VALAAVDLQWVVLAVEVVNAADLSRLDLPGVGTPQVPAAADADCRLPAIDDAMIQVFGGTWRCVAVKNARLSGN
jgi:hypothetical protein